MLAKASVQSACVLTDTPLSRASPLPYLFWVAAISPVLCGSEPARDGGLTAGLGFVDWVHIRCCGNGGLGFRPYGGSLLANAPKVTKRSLPHHSAPRLGSVCPHSGIAPWARREGPSMAQRGYPGIHAGMPTAQYLRSASVVNGAPRSKACARRPYSRPVSPVVLRPRCGSKACSRGGLIADLSLQSYRDPVVGVKLAREAA
ncbi:hypothetical protein SAMN03159297_00531 [Pseudomonas sp. NFACC45]|nr:hypothetical protein SAMN03159297_00531 [Pseudomonas sp. NFACC45]